MPGVVSHRGQVSSPCHQGLERPGPPRRAVQRRQKVEVARIRRPGTSEPRVYFKINVHLEAQHALQQGNTAFGFLKPLLEQQRARIATAVAAFFGNTAPFTETNLLLVGAAGASTKGHADWSEAFNTAFLLVYGSDTSEQVRAGIAGM